MGRGVFVRARASQHHTIMNVQIEKLLTIGGSALIGALITTATPVNAVEDYLAIDTFGSNVYIGDIKCAGPFCIVQHLARNDLGCLWFES